MPGPIALRLAAGALAALALHGCATPRLYSPLELADVAVACQVPTTDLIQDPDFKKVLFFFTLSASPAQLDCVHRWARRHHLHLAYIEGVDRIEP